MEEFMSQDFLLHGETAKTLFHQHAEGNPIIDYHNHLSPRDIAQHRVFRDLTELWLETDHYKWRAMRACGVEERRITGDADGYEKFLAWASVVPQLAGCPLYHWTHLELQRYFNIHTPLTPETAPSIWEETREKLREQDTVSSRMSVLCVRPMIRRTRWSGISRSAGMTGSPLKCCRPFGRIAIWSRSIPVRGSICRGWQSQPALLSRI